MTLPLTCICESGFKLAVTTVHFLVPPLRRSAIFAIGLLIGSMKGIITPRYNAALLPGVCLSRHTNWHQCTIALGHVFALGQVLTELKKT